jgi:hypothetical protein
MARLKRKSRTGISGCACAASGHCVCNTQPTHYWSRLGPTFFRLILVGKQALIAAAISLSRYTETQHVDMVHKKRDTIINKFRMRAPHDKRLELHTARPAHRSSADQRSEEDQRLALTRIFELMFVKERNSPIPHCPQSLFATAVLTAILSSCSHSQDTTKQG